ncbi:hypoxia response transcriptional regulator [soil metagenome]
MLIGEVADATGVSTKTLRYYEREGLLHAPARTPGGYRDYQPQAIDRVGFIKQAQAAGLTLQQIGQVLTIRDDGHPPCAHVAELVDQRLADVEQHLAALQHTNAELREVRSRLDELEPVDCEPGAICSAIT